MASNIPAGLKAADIGRFAVRAAQLERVKPVIAYWCELRVIANRKREQLTDKESSCLYYR